MDKQFIRKLAEFLVNNQAHKSILIETGNALAQEWAALRNATPLRGYPTLAEAEKALTDWLGSQVPSDATTFYAVRNNRGEYYRTYTSSGRRAGWVKDLKSAKVWTKRGMAHARITAIANENPRLPIPELVEFIAGQPNIIKQDERVAKMKLRKQREVAARDLRHREYNRLAAEREVARAQERLDRFR